jgi:hypothetical protein
MGTGMNDGVDTLVARAVGNQHDWACFGWEVRDSVFDLWFLIG